MAVLGWLKFQTPDYGTFVTSLTDPGWSHGLYPNVRQHTWSHVLDWIGWDFAEQLVNAADVWLTLLPLAWVLTRRQLVVAGRDVTLPVLLTLLPGPLSLAFEHHPSGWAIYSSLLVACLFLAVRVRVTPLRLFLVVASAVLLHLSRFEVRLLAGIPVALASIHALLLAKRTSSGPRPSRNGLCVVLFAMLTSIAVSFDSSSVVSPVAMSEMARSLRDETLNAGVIVLKRQGADSSNGDQTTIEAWGSLGRMFAVAARDQKGCGELNRGAIFLVINDQSACGGASVVSVSDFTSYPMRLDLRTSSGRTVLSTLGLAALGAAVVLAFRRSPLINAVVLATWLFLGLLTYWARGGTTGVTRYLWPTLIVGFVIGAPPVQVGLQRHWLRSPAGLLVAAYAALALTAEAVS